MSDNIINTTKAPEPVGLYPHARKVGNLLFLSGIGPREAGTNNIPGLEVDKQGNFLKFDFEFEFDYAQFGYDTTSNYVEFYYSFNQSSLKVDTQNSSTNIEGLLKIFIKDDVSGDTIVFNQWKLKYDVLDTSSIDSQILVGTLGFIIPKGTFTCEITGSDIHSPEKFRVIKEVIKVIPYLHKTLSISDIQLASKMIQGSENTSSIFYKNTYEVIPIPNLVFGKSQPALFFYIEIYNLQSELIKSEHVKINQLLYNSKGKLIKEKSKHLSRNSNTRVEVGSQILSSYPTDSYTLVIALIDSVGNTGCLLYTSPSPRDRTRYRMPSSA